MPTELLRVGDIVNWDGSIGVVSKETEDCIWINWILGSAGHRFQIDETTGSYPFAKPQPRSAWEVLNDD